MSLRAVRSPVAPKTTTAHGSGVRGRRRPARSGLERRAVASSRRRPSAGLHGVAAELVAQRGLHLRAERRRLPRREAPHQRERDDRAAARPGRAPPAPSSGLRPSLRRSPRIDSSRGSRSNARSASSSSHERTTEPWFHERRRPACEVDVEVASRRAARSLRRTPPSSRTRCRCGPSSRSGRRRSGRRARSRRAAPASSARARCARTRRPSRRPSGRSLPSGPRCRRSCPHRRTRCRALRSASARRIESW